MTNTSLSTAPTPDAAEYQAFFPSPSSLAQFTSTKTDLSGADYPVPYKGTKKVLLIGADERYLLTANGKLFSTGNHPVETLLPMYHLHKAGFEFDIATLSGNSVKFEMWAMPHEDTAIMDLYRHYLPRFRQPLKLSDYVSQLGADSDYIGVFIPGGHGALIGLPRSPDAAKVLEWALAHDRYIISICHGPAVFLAPGIVDKEKPSPLKGYSICAFPDAVDRMLPDLGYTPGALTWAFGEALTAQGITIINSAATGATHRDRKVITGDSPFAANALGQLAATTLLEDMARSGQMTRPSDRTGL